MDDLKRIVKCWNLNFLKINFYTAVFCKMGFSLKDPLNIFILIVE